MSDVIVIGGGAAGMMAAGTAAKNGRHVTVLERGERLCKKVRITGKGRCNVTIPENIAPLNFLLRADCEAIEVKAGGLTLNANGNEVVFDIDEWRELMRQSTNEKIAVTVTALIDGKWIQYKPFHWQVVGDRIDPYLTYRLIEPDYEIWNHVQIQQRCVENFEVNAIAHHEQLDNRCMNCHT